MILFCQCQCHRQSLVAVNISRSSSEYFLTSSSLLKEEEQALLQGKHCCQYILFLFGILYHRFTCNSFLLILESNSCNSWLKCSEYVPQSQPLLLFEWQNLVLRILSYASLLPFQWKHFVTLPCRQQCLVWRDGLYKHLPRLRLRQQQKGRSFTTTKINHQKIQPIFSWKQINVITKYILTK